MQVYVLVFFPDKTSDPDVYVRSSGESMNKIRSALRLHKGYNVYESRVYYATVELDDPKDLLSLVLPATGDVEIPY